MPSAQNATAHDRIRTRLARSARAPAGNATAAPTSAVTVVSSPSCVLPMSKAFSSWRARAPILPMSAL